MFGFFASQEKKMRENAANWLELADKVWNFRRDRLSEKDAAELRLKRDELRTQLDERADAAKLKLGIEQLEEILRRTGGAIYPKSALVENVEFFLVAALVILGIRTYFVQPFKIPTNSMWPTYNGMTPEAFRSPSDEPGLAAKVVRFVAFGALTRRVDSPADGEVLIPLTGSSEQAWVPSANVPGKSWLIFPTTLKEYTLYVDGKPARLTVPMDFDFEWAVRDAFFSSDQPSRESARTDLARVAAKPDALIKDAEGRIFLRTGKQVKRGERAMAFDILTGDQLFVDRMSYHFTRPNVGSGFVFRTGNIEGISSVFGDQYYIKRLVGTPGDTLTLKDHTLFRNNAPITGSEAFDKNARQADRYPGYRNSGHLSVGSVLTVPAHHYFAMGDNSPNSADGREWGFVPGKDVVGRPMVVYYPFTKHFGPAR